MRVLLETIRDWVKSIFVEFQRIYLGYVTPQMYGAKGDGQTDDTKAFEECFKDGNKTIVIPKGHYITDTIKVYNNTSIIGYGKETIIEQLPTALHSTTDEKGNVKYPNHPLIAIGNTEINEKTGVRTYYGREHIKIKDITLRGSETYGNDIDGVVLVQMHHSHHIDFDGVIFQNNMYAACRMINGCNYITYNNCRFEATDVGIGSQGVIATKHVAVRNCLFSGLSSYNDFNNIHSEQVSAYNSYDAEGVAEGWIIEDCVFEYKKTNVICFQEWKDGYSPTNYENKILTKDCTVRNVTIRGCVGGVVAMCAKNIVVDGLVVEETTLPQNIEQFETERAFQVSRYCDSLTFRNIIVNDPTLATCIGIHESSTNVNIEGVHIRTSKPNPIGLKGSNHRIENFEIEGFGDAHIRVVCTSLKDSYIDIKRSPNSEKEVIYSVRTGSSGNTFIVNENPFMRIERDDGIDHKEIADTNKYIPNGEYVYAPSNLSQVNFQYVPTEIKLVIKDAPSWEKCTGLNDKYNLLEDGHKFKLRHVWHNGVSQDPLSFTYPTTGNIIPISNGFILSPDYDIISEFEQVDNKWVERKRYKEYKTGIIIDITQGENNIDITTDIDFTTLLGDNN